MLFLNYWACFFNRFATKSELILDFIGLVAAAGAGAAQVSHDIAIGDSNVDATY
jgi:hypothetical protein